MTISNLVDYFEFTYLIIFNDVVCVIEKIYTVLVLLLVLRHCSANYTPYKTILKFEISDRIRKCQVS